MESKTCIKCQVEKALSLFYMDRGKYRTACKECELAQRKQHYIANCEVIKAKRAIYQKAHQKEQYQHLKKWREKFPEKAREMGRRNYAARKEHYAAVKAEWRKNNPEAVRAALEKHRLNNLPKMAEKSHKRRVIERGNGVYEVSDRELRRIYASPCAKCGSTHKVTLDHVIPVVRGGRHSIGNLQPLCLTCNSSKNSKTMAEWKLSLIKKGAPSGALCTS